ncbi:TPA: hypothetical protein RMI67_006337 [Bacillus cereus]|nr:hypothetical protein [Bacillus cereus]
MKPNLNIHVNIKRYFNKKSELEIGYPDIVIFNKTDLDARGDITLATFFCNDITYYVDAHDRTQSYSRGICLVTKITAFLNYPGSGIVYVAEPYTSTGTSYSQYEIVSIDRNKFKINRI